MYSFLAGINQCHGIASTIIFWQHIICEKGRMKHPSNILDNTQAINTKTKTIVFFQQKKTRFRLHTQFGNILLLGSYWSSFQAPPRPLPISARSHAEYIIVVDSDASFMLRNLHPAHHYHRLSFVHGQSSTIAACPLSDYFLIVVCSALLFSVEIRAGNRTAKGHPSC
jgi:hypothetical protein